MIRLKKICFVCDQKENKIFDDKDPLLNRDNCLYSICLLKKELEKIGYDLSTPDINKINDSDFVIYVEMPTILPNNSDIAKSFLILYECEVIRPDNWIFENHKKFKKIFTWNDNLIDNSKYFKINFSQQIPISIDHNVKIKSKLCTIIAGNKKINHPLELYSKRIEAIRWFECNHPEDFDLYGSNWKNYEKLIQLTKFLEIPIIKNNIPKLFNIFPSYKGKIPCKNEILKQYKFCICYENARDIPGYITEKIFDCFFAGCVPIYWGASNISDHIPEGTFIDKREFSSYKNLFDYLKYMDNYEYNKILTNINLFLTSDKVYPFSAEYFAKTLIEQIIGE
jgi:alpha(1,3/1,4) fucosyltransferase